MVLVQVSLLVLQGINGTGAGIIVGVAGCQWYWCRVSLLVLQGISGGDGVVSMMVVQGINDGGAGYQ
jgi:hypothetical protein